MLLKRHLRDLCMVGEDIEWLDEMADVERGIACEHDLCVVQVGFDGAVQRCRQPEISGGEL